jgi:hypothetical protein
MQAVDSQLMIDFCQERAENRNLNFNKRLKKSKSHSQASLGLSLIVMPSGCLSTILRTLGSSFDPNIQPGYLASCMAGQET